MRTLGPALLILAAIGAGLVAYERSRYVIPAPWQPIMSGALRNRADMVAVLRANPDWSFSDLVDLKGFDCAADENGPDRYVELLISYHDGRSRLVELRCICRSCSWYSRREMIFRFP